MYICDERFQIKMKNYKNTFVLLLIFFTIITAQAQRQIIMPEFLQKGDTVGILATARKIDLKSLQPAIKLMKSWGLNVIIGKTIGPEQNQLAGPDSLRAQDFQEMLDNPAIKAIWGAKGGYGTVRIIDKIDFTRFKQKPKFIIGFSDMTVLHSHINNMGIATLHAVMGSTVERATPEAIESFRRALFGEKQEYCVDAHPYNKKGIAEGELVGGNLSVLYSIMGSSSEIDYKGKILFIEDLNEYLYHIDRMMINLKRNGYFDNLNGMIIGGMTSMNDNEIPWGKDALQIIQDVTSDCKFPIIYNFPAGHIRDNRTLIFGRKVSIKVDENEATLQYK